MDYTGPVAAVGYQQDFPCFLELPQGALLMSVQCVTNLSLYAHTGNPGDHVFSGPSLYGGCQFLTVSGGCFINEELHGASPV